MGKLDTSASVADINERRVFASGGPLATGRLIPWKLLCAQIWAEAPWENTQNSAVF